VEPAGAFEAEREPGTYKIDPPAQLRRPQRAMLAIAGGVIVVVAVGGYVVFAGSGSAESAQAAAQSRAAAAARVPNAAAGSNNGDRPGAGATMARGQDEDNTDGDDDDDARSGSERAYRVQTSPPGAHAELLGGGQEGTTPLTFDLTRGQTYQVRFSLDGYVEQVVTIEADQRPKRIKLTPLDRILKVASTPDGAEVLVNGRKRGVTPTSIPLAGSLETARTLRVVVRKRGYAPESVNIVTKDAKFDLDGEALVHAVAIHLKTKPATGAPADKGSSPDAKPSDTQSPANKPPKPDAGRAPPPAEQGPTPDWMR
jgi:hypothetical protein